MTDARQNDRYGMADRTVLARFSQDGTEVVRYDRAGKYYLESPTERRRVNLLHAVARTMWGGGEVFLGKPGGSAFDREYRREVDAAHALAVAWRSPVWTLD